MDLEYNTSTFVAIAVIVHLALLGAFLVNLINLVLCCRSDQEMFVKRPQVLLFSDNLVIIILLYLALWLYPIGGAFLTVIEIIVCINFLLYFNYVKESGLLHCLTASEDIKKDLKEALGEKDNLNLLEQKYPVKETRCVSRSNLTDKFVAVLYLVEGNVQVLPICLKFRVQTFCGALKWQKFKKYFLCLNICLLCIVQIVDYIATDACDKDIGPLEILFTVINIFCTMSTMITLTTFSNNFKKSLSTQNLPQKASTIMVTLVPLNFIPAILNIIDPKMSGYSKDESRRLILICIYSAVLLFSGTLQILLFQTIKIDKKTKQNQNSTQKPVKLSRYC